MKFIRAYPYDKPKQFKADISSPWKLGDEATAINRLKYLSASLILRRPKTTISLPSRRDMQFPVDFNAEERNAYEEVRSQAIVTIEEALQPASGTSEGVSYVNVLQQIESLRLICNLGIQYRPRHKYSKEKPKEDWISVAQRIFNTQRELDPISCLHCSSDIELSYAQLDPSDDKRDGQFFRCLKFFCGECVHQAHQSRRKVGCGHVPPCPRSTVSLVGKATEEAGSLELVGLQSGVELPSKLEALVADIKALPMETKWYNQSPNGFLNNDESILIDFSVVFSTWRLTLDLVEAGLNQHSIGNVRFDGKVPQKDRQSVVNRFKTDPNTRIMLLTLSCGAVG